MSLTRSATLVQQAERARPSRLTESLESLTTVRKSLLVAAASANPILAYSPWARALNEANDHITVRPDEIAAAQDAYNEVANILATKLRWPRDAIDIHPQGSSSTKTLIRSPNGRERFDIDAVCQVDISRVAALDPMGFFQSVGEALQDLDAEAKKRCWCIPFNNQPFYLEFTPSAPLDKVPLQTRELMARRYRAAPAYRATALAVVDTPTKAWKTSNPAGMTQWVDDTAQRQLIRQVALEAVLHKTAASVTPVPDQTVEITDTLRIAIRLFKRHRDMCARRGSIDGNYKPISIIIVTLLTTCYEGLADLGRAYDHPIEVLDDLATLMPLLVLKLDGQYRVDNPTVEGENFAEKWNRPEDGHRYHNAFSEWCQNLSADLKTILAQTEPEAIAKRVREVFGIPAPSSEGAGLAAPGYRAPSPTPRGRGLAWATE